MPSGSLATAFFVTLLTLLALPTILIYFMPERILNLRKRKRKPFIGLLSSLALKRLEDMGWDGIRRIFKLVLDGIIDPIEVARISALQQTCPDAQDLDILTKLGLYEEIIRHAARGCKVPLNLIEEARRHFIVSGLPNWERKASKLLSKESFYDIISNSIVYAYCGTNRVWIKASNLEVELASSMGISSYRDPKEILWTILESARPPLFVYLGKGCPKPEGVRRVELSHLVSIAFPDIEPDVASLSFHFYLDPRRPATLVEKVAKFSRYFLDIVGVEWNKLPETVSSAYMIEPEKPSLPALGSNIVLTDRPRLSMPLFKPYTVEPPSSGEAAEDWDYAAIVALRSLKIRWGDPSRAFLIKRGNPLDLILPRMIAGSLRLREDKPPRPLQVEPQHVKYLSSIIEDGERIVLDCVSPPSKCLDNTEELSEGERELLKVAGDLPLPSPISSSSEEKMSVEIPYNLNIKAKHFKIVEKGELRRAMGSPKIYVSKIPRGLQSIAKITEGLIHGLNVNKLLIVVPSEPLARYFSKALSATLISRDNVSDWYYSAEKVAVIDYKRMLRYPWILSMSDELIVLLPERIVSHESKQVLGFNLLWETLWFAQSLGGVAVSRALRLMYEKGLITEAKIIGGTEEPFIENDSGNIDVKDLVEYSNEVFKELWGPGFELRGYQIDSLYSLYSSLSTNEAGTLIVILPTGAGKSAIFQVSARVLADIGWGSSSLIISPLRALIHDQVRNATKRGLKVAYIDATVSKAKREEILDLALSGILDLLYITPERFENPEFEGFLREGEPSLIVLDEAHTLSRWGMSFRPSYLYMAKVINEIRKERKDLPVMALTATAPQDVVDDIIEVLGKKNEIKEIKLDLRSPPSYPNVDPGNTIILRASPIRDEITFDVRPGAFGEDRIKDLATLIKDLAKWADTFGESWIGLIYTGYVKSRKLSWANAEELAKRLSSLIKEEVIYYHGKLTPRQREQIENLVERVSKGEEGPRLVVATKAFGMGIDIPNIRFVVHFTPSDSVEDYYQEVGRAARDGKEAKAVAYYNLEDFKIKENIKLKEAIKPSDVLVLYNFIVQMARLSRNRKEALIPSQAFYKLLGSKERFSKALEILRLSGMLDYTVIEGSPYIDSNGECLIKIGKYCLSISDHTEGTSIKGRIIFCVDRNTPIPQVKMQVLDKSFGDPCENGTEIMLMKDRYYYIELSPWKKHSPRLALPPDVYIKTLFMSRSEIKKIEELKDLFEEALKAKSKGGASVDRIMRSSIKKALERNVENLKLLEEVLKKLGVRECDALEDCLKEMGDIVIKLNKSIGEGSYMVAVAGSELASVAKRYIEERLGRTIKDPAAEYRRLLSSARRGPHSLLNKGFIVLLVSEGSRSLKIMLEKLSEYPYKFVFILKKKGNT